MYINKPKFPLNTFLPSILRTEIGLYPIRIFGCNVVFFFQEAVGHFTVISTDTSLLILFFSFFSVDVSPEGINVSQAIVTYILVSQAIFFNG